MAILIYYTLILVPTALATPDCGQHGFYYGRRLRIHYVANGEKGKPLMLFIHGYPQFWYCWRHQLKEFGKDYYAVAVDNRGYGDTGRPTHMEDYDIKELIEDVKDIIVGLGYEKCTLVAHDWGGFIAWHFAHFHPEYLEKLIIMNAPHPRIFKQYMETHITQALKSWYIFFYQIPYLPEFVESSSDYELIDIIMTSVIHSDPKTKDIFTKDDEECYKYNLSRPSCLTSAINYYRQNVFIPPLPFKYDKITAPTLIIWGEKDDALNKELNNGIAKYVDSVILKYMAEGTHWISEQFPEETNKHMRDFLQ
ncbi:uncharacterized protein TRIADDRAFT_55400 [Trichoplax adhaerens]|uniref:AB hydrolase-1 domain-containing protein n=1 Tax=Trichoplax adhaerens TaxID=10228 RepID=B3RUT0_TRIAD|nr:hypothetical protein TRIADDRAFT_55400 [Trichoplax adhaerens]EDV25377.1 hypothetical protein TRIADDRAFT_55400 [Trichoplax adhaerens]|eukprot:XP_002111410.1 hypothetical protein TRIADDRAFT_55400 [Trichoplax adhaerens]